MGIVQSGIPLRVTASTAILASLAIAACGGGGGSGGGSTNTVEPIEAAPYTYSMPPDTADGWKVGEMTAEGFESAKILEMMERVVTEDFRGIDSVAIVRNNTLVLYWYSNRELDEFDEWIQNTNPERHVLHSTSKTFTSALVGIAVDQGYIESTEVSFLDLFDYSS